MPDVVALELPADLGQWIEWLGHPEAEAPLAIAAVDGAGNDLAFHPFADFSPELAAIRWACVRGVPVVPIDLPCAHREAEARSEVSAPPGIMRALIAREEAGDAEALWDQLVEARAVGADPERVRRAALLYGWAIRRDDLRGGGVSARDTRREAHMACRLGEALVAGKRVAAVVGAYHAQALVAPSLVETAKGEPREVVSSLIPYAFDLLDSRSGYPAGIRDPMWHQLLWERASRQDAASATEDLVAGCLVAITRHVRATGHAASVADARAASQLASELAQLRRLPAPGRRELVEGVQSALAQGELQGRGRAIARAMQQVLVGRRRGRTATGTPRCGLVPHVTTLLEALRLPGPSRASEEASELRLDPLRSRLDRRRHVALARLCACGIPYARETRGQAAGGLETLTRTWTVRWQPATEALLELAGVRGSTLRRAAVGALQVERARLASADALTGARRIALLVAAAECGLGDVVTAELDMLTGEALGQLALPDLIALLTAIEEMRAAHIVGLPSREDAVDGEIDAFALPEIDDHAILSAAGHAAEGLEGSNRREDALALLALVRRLLETNEALPGRVAWLLRRIAQDGSPLMQGAAIALVVVAGGEAGPLGRTLGGWFDAAVDAPSRQALAARLSGALLVAEPLFETAPAILESLSVRLETCADEVFLERLPALREGFETLSTAARARLLAVIIERHGWTHLQGRSLDAPIAHAPELLAACARADAVGRAAADAIERPALDPPPLVAAQAATMRPPTATEIGPLDRWKLVLGRVRETVPPRAQRAARALDELYGHGHGEGSQAELGGGQEPAFATAREWGEEIEALFGDHVFEEVAARAATRGRSAALLDLTPDRVTPSIELLVQILSLRGGLPEAHVARLRPLVRRIVEALTRELATRVRPALIGVTTQRATRRGPGRLHLRNTLGANLHTARVEGDRIQLAPERLFFQGRARRQLDWRIILLVDVSGSMEPSVIYSALMAAILSAVPWIDVRFVAFSTNVADLSSRASDPLALLLEISVGGGTHIAQALRYARGLVDVPARTLLFLVSDFEEGFAVESLLAEVRAIVESGVTALGLAALDDRGKPRYATPIAELVAGCGMPVAALTPLELARWVGERIR